MCKSFLSIVLLMAATAGFALSQVPDANQSGAEFDIYNFEKIFAVPDGSGETLSEAGKQIDVWLRDQNGNPISGFPSAQIELRFEWCMNYIHFGTCPLPGDPIDGHAGSGIYATCATDENGHTVVDGAFHAGGGSPQCMFWIVVIKGSQGEVLFYLPLYDYLIDFVSPDLNWDYTVDLADTPLFSQYFQQGSLAVDFNRDGFVNLQDVVLYSSAFGAECPGW